MRRTVGTWARLAVVVGMMAAAHAASAEEAKAPVSAAMILNMMTQPVESREAAFEQSLRDGGAAPASPGAGEVLPDGSVRYGRMTVTVKNPCPPGTAHYEPPPLPGRRRK